MEQRKPEQRERVTLRLVQPEPPDTVVHVAGDVSLSTVPAIYTLLNRVLHTGVRQVVLDMANVRFCSVAGAQALLTVQRQAQARGDRIVLDRPSPAVRHAVRVHRIEGGEGAEEMAGG